MKYSVETQKQILKEIEEVGNITLVCNKHGIKRTTVMNWLHKVKNKDKIADKKVTRVLEKKIKDQEHEIEEISHFKGLLSPSLPQIPKKF